MITDTEWLLQRMPKATENIIEAFNERVAIMLERFGDNVTDTQVIIARGEALSDLKKRYE